MRRASKQPAFVEAPAGKRMTAKSVADLLTGTGRQRTMCGLISVSSLTLKRRAGLPPGLAIRRCVEEAVSGGPSRARSTIEMCPCSR
jgi:hypothetical protein